MSSYLVRKGLAAQNIRACPRKDRPSFSPDQAARRAEIATSNLSRRPDFWRKGVCWADWKKFDLGPQ